MKKLLELKNVSLTYYTETDEIQAIKGLTFDCNEGDFLSIIGPSGCGKTSILSLIAGLLTPTSGKILIDGKESNSLSESLGYMLQKDHLFNWRTIEKNVFLPLEIKKICNKENKKYALDLLNKYGLSDFKKNYPSQLSGGMRQRVALIRTLATGPDVLLLDEPFSALDYRTRLIVSDDVYKIIKNEGKSAILVTHDISEGISMSDKVVVLSKRPATVKYIQYIALRENYNLTSLQTRKVPQFQTYFDIIWKEFDLVENK